MSDIKVNVSEPTRIITIVLTPVQAADILTDLDRAAASTPPDGSAIGSGTSVLMAALNTVTAGKEYIQP